MFTFRISQCIRHDAFLDDRFVNLPGLPLEAAEHIARALNDALHPSETENTHYRVLAVHQDEHYSCMDAHSCYLGSWIDGITSIWMSDRGSTKLQAVWEDILMLHHRLHQETFAAMAIQVKNASANVFRAPTLQQKHAFTLLFNALKRFQKESSRLLDGIDFQLRVSEYAILNDASDMARRAICHRDDIYSGCTGGQWRSRDAP